MTPLLLSVLSKQAQVEKIKPDVANGLNAKIRFNQQSIEKLEAIRNQACAHLWKKKTMTDVYVKVAAQVNAMKEIVNLTREVILEVAEIAGNDRRSQLERQQLSETTLKCVADDARKVFLAFAGS